LLGLNRFCPQQINTIRHHSGNEKVKR
jgi:hypothetical protein